MQQRVLGPWHGSDCESGFASDLTASLHFDPSMVLMLCMAKISVEKARLEAVMSVEYLVFPCPNSAWSDWGGGASERCV